MNFKKNYLSLTEAARRLGFSSRQAIVYHVKHGHIVSTAILGRPAIEERDLDKFIEWCRLQAEKPSHRGSIILRRKWRTEANQNTEKEQTNA